MRNTALSAAHSHTCIESYKEGCKHINLVANSLNLGKIIKDGVLSDIPSIHRITIDGAMNVDLRRN